jgi:hypothetical protein
VSLYDYNISKEIQRGDPPFYALIMVAMRKAGTANGKRLAFAFPATWAEL